MRLGRAMACRLAERGYNIALHHGASSPMNTLEQIIKHGAECRAYSRDFGNPAYAEGLIDDVLKDFGDVELLVNSAANFILENLEETKTESLFDTMNVNLLAPFLLMREYKRKVNRGMIVNILDQRVLKNISTFGAYSVAKKGLEHLTHLGAVEWGASVRVNGIAPGLILPPPGGPEDYPERQARNIPTQTHGTEADVLRGLDYLIDSPFVNGEVLFIDGGESKASRNSKF